MSEMMSLAQAASVLGCDVAAGEIGFSGVSTDTRTLRSGDLFIALDGPNFDAHTLLASARQKGAVAAVVNRPVDDPLVQLPVADTRLALGCLAAAWRERFNGRLVAITGSNGKTTVKEMVASILSCRGEVLATAGNFNNDIGMPLTLLRLRPAQHHYAVIEMGANHKGEIAYLSRLARPDVALVTNAAAAHLAGFGSLDDVARAKGEIWQGLKPGGVAVINADDRYADEWNALVAGDKVIHFGLEADVALKCDAGACVARGQFRNQFTLATPLGDVDISLQLTGQHNVTNAMAATAVAIAAGADLAEVAQGLARMRPVKGRLQPRISAWGQLLIDDSYNANPDSVGAAIDVLGQMAGEKILVLGDMAELGDGADEQHRQVGALAAQRGVNGLLATGPLCRQAVKGFGCHGQWFETKEELIKALASYLAKSSDTVTVLVKGSRSAAMEQVIDSLVSGAGEAAAVASAANIEMGS
ncbi:MAG TPA: UDP-N-acetylmuramoyl-tripeptide--D-alanyl-D-alanine ligase [Candidatus Tenderia sp.]|nr:UDP-N-acetylmuramoyl-tripeptide--D-alanyl-D-alanine ligase [Candidatus Tenderia sp.]